MPRDVVYTEHRNHQVEQQEDQEIEFEAVPPSAFENKRRLLKRVDERPRDKKKVRFID